jgi:hypothetical protein
MSRVAFNLQSELPPERILAAARDFSDRRPELWPMISRHFYKVHAAGGTWADVTEGSDVFGGIWARERYDWSTPGMIRAVVQDSNVFKPGGIWEMCVRPSDGGSRIEVINDRQGRTLKGRIMRGMLAIMGRKVLAAEMRQTLGILAQQGHEHVRAS